MRTWWLSSLVHSLLLDHLWPFWYLLLLAAAPLSVLFCMDTAHPFCFICHSITNSSGNCQVYIIVFTDGMGIKEVNDNTDLETLIQAANITELRAPDSDKAVSLSGWAISLLGPSTQLVAKSFLPAPSPFPIQQISLPSCLCQPGGKEIKIPMVDYTKGFFF